MDLLGNIMATKDKKLRVEFLPAKPADNEIENNVLITQLMITATNIGIRDLKKDNCVIIEKEVKSVESS